MGCPILGRQAKLDRLNEAAEGLGLTGFDVLSMGDGANDMSMIEAAGLGIGFRPHPILAEASDAVITGKSLETALYFQGISTRRMGYRLGFNLKSVERVSAVTHDLHE